MESPSIFAKISPNGVQLRRVWVFGSIYDDCRMPYEKG
jgi:hypothetical protein